MLTILRLVGWVLVVVGAFIDPTDTGQTVMTLGIVMVLLSLSIGQDLRR